MNNVVPIRPTVGMSRLTSPNKTLVAVEPAGFSAGSHDGALFTLKRRCGENFAKGARQPLCEWYSAEQMRTAFEAGRLAERNTNPTTKETHL